jgi:hypothetical protein
MEQGPVLILTFSAQQTMCAIDARGKVVEGGEVCMGDDHGDDDVDDDDDDGDYDGGCDDGGDLRWKW